MSFHCPKPGPYEVLGIRSAFQHMKRAETMAENMGAWDELSLVRTAKSQLTGMDNYFIYAMAQIGRLAFPKGFDEGLRAGGKALIRHVVGCELCSEFRIPNLPNRAPTRPDPDGRPESERFPLKLEIG